MPSAALRNGFGDGGNAGRSNHGRIIAPWPAKEMIFVIGLKAGTDHGLPSGHLATMTLRIQLRPTGLSTPAIPRS